MFLWKNNIRGLFGKYLAKARDGTVSISKSDIFRQNNLSQQYCQVLCSFRLSSHLNGTTFCNFRTMEKIEYRAVRKYLFLKNETNDEIKTEFSEVYGYFAPSLSTNKYWTAEFKRMWWRSCMSSKWGYHFTNDWKYPLIENAWDYRDCGQRNWKSA